MQPRDFHEFIATIGFVFVSFAGLTKVASVAEEVKNPERNLPLGMMLSLTSTTLMYVVGVWIMVLVLPAADLSGSLTPVAAASDHLFHWLPGRAALVFVVTAAVLAFASTGNVGLLSASRYPLAMARDHLISKFFAKLGRWHTPLPAILATGGILILIIALVNVEGIAKLASAFQLLIFALVNLAVIVMRESRIESYDPGYRAPWYPWLQIFGLLTPFILIGYMGWVTVAFTVGVIAAALLWYFHYARHRVRRDGAIYHWFAHLGKRRDEGLDRELRGILKEKGLRDEDPFDEVVAAAKVLDFEPGVDFEAVTRRVAHLLSEELPLSADELASGFLDGTRTGSTPVTQGVALPHLRVLGIAPARMILVRCRGGMFIEVTDILGNAASEGPVNAIFFLVSPEENPRQHLRILAKVAERVDDEGFLESWLHACDDHELKEILMRDEHFLSMKLLSGTAAAELIGKSLRELELPPGALVALIRRGKKTVVPGGSSVLEENDMITVIGEPATIRQLTGRYLPV